MIVASLTQNHFNRPDWILFAYLGTCAVTLWDILATLVQDTTLAQIIGGALV